MAGQLTPIVMGGRVLQVPIERAIDFVRAGIARMLPPGPKFAGSQSAGPNAAGPFYSAFRTNMQPTTSVMNPLSSGLAGAAGAATLASSSAPSIFDRSGAASELRPPISGVDDVRPPISGMAEAGPDYGSMGGPDMLQRALAMTARPAKEAPMPVRRPAETPMRREEVPVPPTRSMDSGPSSRDLWERYNESGSAADFIMADRAMRAGRAEGGGIPMGMEGMRPPPIDMPEMPPMPKPAGAGQGAGGRDAAINKALEIIHHLIIRNR